MSNLINIKTMQEVIPMCYAYTTPQIAEHNGWVKIGYTEKDVEKRIKEQTQTVHVKAQLEWKETAIFDDGSGDTFTDKDFHAYLRKQNVEYIKKTEWFKISPQDSRQQYLVFKGNKGILKTLGVLPYNLREEQQRATEQTTNYFLGNSDTKEFLWNAKPRFGKTLATYDLCKQLGAKKILIVTNRPAIANSWYDDYVKFVGTEDGFYFISETEALKGKPYVITRDQFIGLKAKGYFEFISLQDLKGSQYLSAHGRYDKLKAESGITWDLLVVDEAHEGVDTDKTDDVFNKIKRKYTLHLSGTPFKALADNKFNEKAIFNWTYAYEQKKKKEWDYSNGENPYEPLPQLNLYTYQMSEIVKDFIKKGDDFYNDGNTEEYAFDLNEFFSTNNSGSFKHDESVDAFLDALTKQMKFPFSTPELRAELKHTFWLLDRVDSAKALAKKLKEHPVFKDYEIVLCAGDGKIDDYEENEKSFDKVRKAIGKYDKTITLSVGQLTTGVTIPEWTAVLMLSNVGSPAKYMQAAFRAQNPCLFKQNGIMLRKENCYVFDFDPARTLTIFEQFANNLSTRTVNGQGDTETRKHNVKELLNFFPVYGEDEEGEMVALDPEKVLSIPRAIYSQEVVKRGFMCNFLFQNISNIFGAPREILDILRKFDAVSGKELSVDPATKDKLSLDENGNVVIPQKQIIGKAQEVFGKKIYKIESIDDILSITPEKTPEKIKQLLQEKVHKNITEAIIKTTKENYGTHLSRSKQKELERNINSIVDKEITKQVDNLVFDTKQLEIKQTEEIQKAKKENRITDIPKIKEEFEQEKQKLEDNFKKETKDIIENAVENAKLEIIEAVETDIKRKEKKTNEEEIREHLRGFARTIPSFLMAYGNEQDITLENFDTIIPNDVFKEVTSITIDEFKLLRDGGDYKDKETGETKHYEGHLFDPIVFNDSIKEFISLKDKLSNYFDENNKEDIFDYIPPQKTNQIFTPKKVVKMMVENLEKEYPNCFENENKTFIDLYMKSGLYIAEIVKRLYNSNRLKELYPQKETRLRHIFEKQVYGLAPTEIIYRIALAFILGFDKQIHIEKHNLRQFDTLPSVKQGTLETDLDKVFGK